MFDYNNVLPSEDGETRIVKLALLSWFLIHIINLWVQDICNALPEHLSTPSNWVENQLKVIHE